MPKPLTIAMLSIHSSPLGNLGTRDTGGMSVYVLALAHEMGRAGHEVDIFTLRRHPEERAVSALASNVRIVTVDSGQPVPPAKNDLHRHADDLAGAIESFRSDNELTYDLIHSHYWVSGQVGRLLGERWKRPQVITFHTLAAMKNSTRQGKPEPVERQRAERQLVHSADALLVACQREKENLEKCYAADPERINLVPGGVDFERFHPQDRAAARRRLGFDRKDFILLSIGRLAALKGQAQIIAALAQCDDDVRLVLVGGDGPADREQQRLQQLAARAGVAARVVFTGSIPHRELPAYYAAADVYVQASHYESFGLVGLEALACGRPVVTSPVGIMATLGQRQQPGCHLTDGSPAALAAGVRALRDDAFVWTPEEIHEAVGEFSWPRAAAAALAAYRGAIRQRPSDAACEPSHDRGSPATRSGPRRMAALDKQRINLKI